MFDLQVKTKLYVIKLFYSFPDKFEDIGALNQFSSFLAARFHHCSSLKETAKKD